MTIEKFSINDINRAVNGYGNINNSPAWHAFRLDLLRHEVVQLPGVGYASFVEQPDSAYSDGPTYFIFGVQTPAGEPKRHFKKAGYDDSYDGISFDAPLVEVASVPITKTQWQEVK